MGRRIACQLLAALGLVWAFPGGEPTVLAGETEAYQHLAERMDAYVSGDEPRLIESYASPYPPGPDGTLADVAFLYDNALAAIVLVDRGSTDDLRRARLICDAILWHQQHDAFGDGRLRQGYRASQDLAASDRPKLPTGFNHSLTGELAWAGLALLTYFEAVRDPQVSDPFQDPSAAYLNGAVDLANFLVAETRDPQGEGFRLGFQEAPVEITVGVPVADYGPLTQQPQTLLIPLDVFAAQDLNLERLRAFSLVFNDPQHATGTITFEAIKLVNPAEGTELVIDDFADSQPLQNTLGYQIGGIVDIWADPSGKIISWNSADGSVDWWYSLLTADVNSLVRLDGADDTHLALTVSGLAGGENFTVELQGYRLSQELRTTKATEHQLDVYAFFLRLFALTGDPTWKSYALEAKAFLDLQAWEATEGRFLAGRDPGGQPDLAHLVEDVQSWALLVLGRVDRYGSALDWAETTLGLTSDGFTGHDYGLNVDPGDPWYSPTPDGVWFEGTAQMSAAYQVSGTAGGPDWSSAYLSRLDQAQQTASGANGKALVAASHDGVTTGLPYFSYYASPHIGATAWYLAAARYLNLFWGTPTTERVPFDGDPPTVSLEITPTTVTAGEPFTITVTGTSLDGLAAVWWWGQETGVTDATVTISYPASPTSSQRFTTPVVNPTKLDRAFGSPLFSADQAVTSYSFSSTVVVPTPGTYQFGANARDVLYPVPGEPHQASEGAGIQIVAVENQPPTANAGADQTTQSYQLVTLQGSGSDPDGDTLSYQWMQAAGPTVSLQDATAPTARFTAPAVTQPTTTTFLLRVDDGEATALDTVDVTITPAPGFGIGGCSYR